MFLISKYLKLWLLNIHLLSFGFLLFNLFPLFAQDSDEDLSVNTQFWLDYNMKNYINELKSVSGFLGYRSISPHAYNKFLVVPSYNFLHTKAAKFLNLEKPLIHSFHLGGGLYYTQYLDEPDNLEIRLMQGFKFFTPPIKNIFIKNYIRLEERFQKTMEGSSNWSIGLRFRYRISTAIEWKKHLFSFNKGLYLPMSVEVFFSIKETDRFNDKIRISPGIGYKLNDDWKFEIYVTYNRTKNTTEMEDTTNDFTFRLRIFKTSIKKGIFLKDKDKEENFKELIE